MPVKPVPGVLDASHGSVAATDVQASAQLLRKRGLLRRAAQLSPGSTPQNLLPPTERARHAACARASRGA